MLASLLHRSGLTYHAVRDVNELASEVHRGAATAVVTEESLSASSDGWIQRLRMQPAWSDFPLIVLTGVESDGAFSSKKLANVRSLGNVTLLERPLHHESLLSAVHAALRARERQYEIREYMQRQADSQEALRRTEKLAVAGRLAASIAHEINNPLAAITNLLYLASTSKSLDEAKKYATIAQDELKRVSEIANQTLRFYRAPADPEQVNAGKLVESAIVLFRAKIRSQGIRIERDFGQDCDLECSVGEIRQVLVNLIANALESMRNGGALFFRTTSVAHPLTEMPGVRITIADHGEGVSEQARKRLFDAFSTTKGSGGTGLGLWLTKDIIDRSQGFIRFRNHHHPHGAVFSLWLPKETLRVEKKKPEEARTSA